MFLNWINIFDFTLFKVVSKFIKVILFKINFGTIAAERNIVSTDTLIITINARALAKIADEGDNLYKSVSDLVLYATGAAACSTSDLILVLSSINQSLDNIKKHLNKAYFDTWKYIQVRIGYWKRQVYRAKTKQEIIEGAFGRWKGAGYLGY